MKYENFEEAKSIVALINREESVLRKLSSDNVTLKLTDGDTILTIGAWHVCEHPLKDDAINFVSHLKGYYQHQIKTLHERLEAL